MVGIWDGPTGRRAQELSCSQRFPYLSITYTPSAKIAGIGHAATSTRTSGWRSAIFRSCFAAPEGLRRPCSHCSKVRFDTPSATANFACERPPLSRTPTTYDLASMRFHFPPPALISRTPSRTSCYISRLASNLASALPVSLLSMWEYLQ